MNIVLTHNQFNSNNIYFNEPIQNTVMDNSRFIKLIYSNENIMLNGIFLLLNIKIINKETYFKKIKISYDISNSINKEILMNIYNIENNILLKYKSTKKPRSILYETLNSGVIKIFPNIDKDINNSNSSFILKISGIWEDDKEYGLTYKILFT
jgi:hypothetical protein|tara:strand:+ start:457 stop:915 length:459 start_codon:yes stop_codon:yes gene_type:complete